MESPSNGDLPPDVVQEILLRLPVKTLLRFKCVCKHWCTLIESPSFVNWHFAHESNQERLLIRHYKPYDYCHAFALYADDISCGYEEPDHLQIPETVEVLMGPVNGVFFMTDVMGEMALANPAMRQFKLLPAPHWDVQPHLSSFDKIFGLGLDRMSGDYKVVLIQYFWNKEMDVLHKSALASVYSLSSDSWRYFEDAGLVYLSRLIPRSLRNTYLDGVCYWLVEFDDAKVAVVLAFDMTTEKFREIEVPDCVKSGNMDLALYGDSIALLSYSYEWNNMDKYMDIWVMKKEGCWTKSSTVGPFKEIRLPLCFWKSSELILQTGSSRLFVCNVFTQRSRTIKARSNVSDPLLHWVFSYKESLVSIKVEGNNCIFWDTSSDCVKYFLEYSSSDDYEGNFIL